MILKLLWFVGLATAAGLIVLAVIKSLRSADTEQKLEDINSDMMQYNKIKDIDVDAVKERQKKLDEFKSM